MVRATRKEWARRVALWKRSGLTAKEFSAREGLKASTLSYWSWKLESLRGAAQKEEAEHEKGGAAERRQSPKRKRGVGVYTRDDFLGFELVAPPASGAELEIVVDGALRVRVPSGFDEATLRRVVGVLREGA